MLEKIFQFGITFLMGFLVGVIVTITKTGVNH
jgi:hypothetical protein